MTDTTKNGYSLPHPDNIAVTDISRIRETILAIDGDISSIRLECDVLKEDIERSQAEFKDTVDQKFNKLSEVVKAHLANIDKAKATLVDNIDALKSNLITSVEERVVENIATIDSQVKAKMADLDKEVNVFKTVNDIPAESSIMTEIKSNNWIKKESLPFIFAILSDNGDNSRFSRLKKRFESLVDNETKAKSIFKVVTGT